MPGNPLSTDKMAKKPIFEPDKPLTKSLHENPDFHYIGESLPVPTKVKGLGTAAVGTSATVAREDHVHPFYDSNGNILFKTSGSGVTKLNGRSAFFLVGEVHSETSSPTSALTSGGTACLSTSPLALLAGDLVHVSALGNVHNSSFTGASNISMCVAFYLGGVFQFNNPIPARTIMHSFGDTIPLALGYNFYIVTPGNWQWQIVAFNDVPANNNAYVTDCSIQVLVFGNH